MTFLERLRAYSTSRFTHSEELDAAVMTTTKLSQFAMPFSISGQNFSSGRMALTSLNTSSKPAARRNDSISATKLSSDVLWETKALRMGTVVFQRGRRSRSGRSRLKRPTAALKVTREGCSRTVCRYRGGHALVL